MTLSPLPDMRVARAVQVIAASIVVATATGAQSLTQLADRGPVFYRVASGHTTRVDVRSVAVLQRSIGIDLEDVPLADAIDSIASKAQIRIVYTPTIVPGMVRVTLVASNITVAGALRVTLDDVGVDVRISPQGALSLSKREEADGQLPAKVSAIHGVVTDSGSHAVLAGATVQIEASGQSAISGVDGRYEISAVRPGVYRLVARRLGYLPQRRSLSVDTGAVYEVDFAMTASAAVLDRIVTTVTGNTEEKTLGNTIATIAADSVVAPGTINSLSDIITARAAGVQVFSDGGLAGAAPTINIRGQNSLNGTNQPLLYIDGIRVDNSAANTVLPNVGSVAWVSAGRFDDLLPDEIESIQVIKGPSAATLYGTDAANGVILVKTKRGTPGRTHWDVYGEKGTLDAEPFHAPAPYHGWGQAAGAPAPCSALGSVSGVCTLDSVTHFSPFQLSTTSPFGSGEQNTTGAQVSGGVGRVTYFLSGDYADQRGYLTMPAPDVALVEAERGGQLPHPDELHPNGTTRLGFRESLAAALGNTAEVSVTSGVVARTARVPFSSLLTSGVLGPGYLDANDGWAAGARPANLFIGRNDEDVTHLTAGVSGNWRPLAWLFGQSTIGVDYADSYIDQLTEPNELAPGDPGHRTNARTNTTLYTATIGATATFDLTRAVTTATSIGGSYNRTTAFGNIAAVQSLTAGCLTVLCGTNPVVGETDQEFVVAGVYAEELVTIGQNLFLRGGIRDDGSSSFGRAFGGVAYPKASASWLLSQEPFMPHLPGVSSLRLRAAYGESGLQPPALANLNIETPRQVFANGAAQVGSFLTPGNPSIRPERVSEFEGGVDLDLFASRVHAEATVYRKRSADALVIESAPTSVGSFSQYVNVGAVRNQGYEFLVSVRVLQSRAATWDVRVNGSFNQNQLLEANAASQFKTPYQPSVQVGYPLFGWFASPVSYRDSNHDGIIEPSEVSVDTSLRYLAPSFPPMQLSASQTLGLFDNHVRLSATVDYRTGYRFRDETLFIQCLIGACRGAVDPKAPLSDQAAAVALSQGATGAFDVDGTFAKVREVSLTYDLPSKVARAMHARALSISFAGRNLVSWHPYYLDPETAGSELEGPRAGAYAPSSYFVPARSFSGRINVGF